MTNQKSTKKTLLASALSLVLCITMLIGTTFAWFTDNVTSAGNKIVAGNLDVQLLMNTGDGYKDISDSTSPIFGAGSVAQNNNAETLWEPGKTQVAYLAIKNNGNLALKYSVALDVKNVSKNLYEVMEYAITPNAQYDAKPAWVGGNAVVVGKQPVSGTVSLGVGATHYFALSIHMQETAGNEYMNGEVDFDLTVLATQDTVEADSFDNQYDRMATIDTEEKLLEAIATDYDLIKLGSNIELTQSLVIPAGKTVAIDLAGYTMSQSKACTEHYAMIENKGNLNILDSFGTGKISFEDTGAGDANFGWGSYTIHNNGGKLVVEGGTIEHLGAQAFATHCIVAIFQYSGSTTINGGTVACPAYRPVRLWKGDMTINGGTFDGQVWVHCVDDSAKLTVNGGTFSPNGRDASSLFVNNKNASTGAVYQVDLAITGGNFTTKLGMNSAVKCVTGGTFGANPSAYVADGYKAVAVGEAYEVIPDTTTYATAATATELQTALDNAANVNLIVLTDDIEGDVTVKQISDLVITVNGDGHKFAGVFVIDGNSAQEQTSGVTLKNIDFVADSISADAVVRLGEAGDNSTRYTCNVTVDNCYFDVPGAVGIKSYTGGDKNLTITGCTTSDDLHSLAQLKGIDGVLVENCTVTSARGINFNNSVNVKVEKSTIDVQKYALRFGSDENSTVENFAITDCTLKSANLGGDPVIEIRAGAKNANLTITNTSIIGSIRMTGHENANIVIQ